MKIPVVYDLDEYGEADGTVHPFCNNSCRSLWLTDKKIDGAPDSSYAKGENDEFDIWDNAICEQCLAEIFEPQTN